VKARLKLHIGTPVEHQRLIHKVGGSAVQELSDNSKMLGYYSVESGQEIHIIDTDPFSLSRGGGLTDVSLVEKFRMTDDDYDKRSGTMRDFIRKKRVNDPTYKLKPQSKPPPGMGGMPERPVEPVGPETVAGMNVGDRCQVMPGKRRGVIMFVGEIEGLKAGHWVSVSCRLYMK
jgi:tubulin-folding cofactor B